jgi:hypothetical protein
MVGKRVFKCIEFTFNNPTVLLVWPRPTIEEVVQIYRVYIYQPHGSFGMSTTCHRKGYTLFDGRSWSYQRNRGVVKYKLYTFKHPVRW